MTSVPARLAAFAVVLAVVFGGGLALGRTAGPDDVRPAAEHGDGHDARHDTGHNAGHNGGDHGGKHGARDRRHAGAVRLELDRRRVAAGADRRVTFRLLDRDGAPLASYVEKHERDLHLVVVGTPGLRDYQHLHPTRDGDRWTARMALSPGRYRAYADGRTDGADFVAETTLRVPGVRVRDRVPRPSTRDRVGPYAVTLAAADDGTATLRVTRNGAPVTDLQPYLGASGHLVVIRRGSLDYLHAHPEDGPPGPEVSFAVDYGRPGLHRLFFDFQHEGRVRTAAFTLRVGRDGGPRSEHGGGHEH